MEMADPGLDGRYGKGVRIFDPYLIYLYIWICWGDIHRHPILSHIYMGLSENRVNLPNEIAIFHRDNDQQNHWL